jgi:hypothetical protein
MRKKALLLSAISICLLLSFVAYELLYSQVPVNSLPQNNNGTQTNDDDTNATLSPTATIKPRAESNQQTNQPNNSNNHGSSKTIYPTTPPTVDPSVPDISSPHQKDHEKASDYTWNTTDVINVALSGNSITTSTPDNTQIEGSKITITSAGNYRFTGSLTDGQIIVNTQDKDTVRLILSNIDISCSNSAPIYVMAAKKTIMFLEENTVNTVKDTKTGNTAEPNAAIFSAADLTIFGSGQLKVQGNNNDAISSKDGLIIKSGIINADALDDGIRGKDYLIIKGGNITVTAGGDGFKSDNAEDATRGYITIEDGSISITSGGDAISARTDATITGGQFTLTAAGGSSGGVGSSLSAKGIKGIVNVTITGGSFTVNSADDCIHSNRTITLTGGLFTLSTGDDAIHADKLITVRGGTIDIVQSYEGLESTDILIEGNPVIHITSTDDGINGAGGNDGSGFKPPPNFPGPGGGFVPGNRTLTINGGYIVITNNGNPDGDGIDINGPITMTAGYVIINGPKPGLAESAIDWEGSFTMSGGFIIGVGSSVMPMTVGQTSTQCGLLLNFRTAKPAGTLIHIQSSTGTEVITFNPVKSFQSIAISSPQLKIGLSYDLYLGGSSTGTLSDGVYQNGVYTPGTKTGATLTLSNITTTRYNL